MTTFLWMLYLAFTIFISIVLLTGIIADGILFYMEKLDKEDKGPKYHIFILTILMIITSLLWSIWYHYYLH